jgi:membrane-associated phospholipid phosphatase
MDPPDRPRRLRRYTRPLRGSLTVSALLAATFVLYTWLVIHWGPFIRLDDFLDRNYHVQSLWPVLTRVDRIGQRAICLPILTAVVGITVWRHRSWRPALLAGIAVFSVNLLVLIAKVAMTRGRPVSGRGFFSGGDMYPSGHTANILLVYGLCFHLIAHYGHVSARTKRVLLWAVCVLGVVMFTTSLTLRWHWFSDLVGGFLIGGAVLALTVGIDAALPFRSRRMVVIPAPARPSDPPSDLPNAPVSVASAPTTGPDVRETLSLRRTPFGSRAAAGDRRSRR